MRDDDEALLDTTSEETAVTDTPKKKKVKKAKEKKGNGTTGRPVSAETTEARKKILQLGKRKDGITNIELAQELDVSTAVSQSLARPLVAGNQLKMFKSKENGRVIYKTA